MVISISGITERQFLHLDELMNDPDFLDSVDFENEINLDIVQLIASLKVNEVSDQEDIDDNILDNMK